MSVALCNAMAALDSGKFRSRSACATMTHGAPWRKGSSPCLTSSASISKSDRNFIALATSVLDNCRRNAARTSGLLSWRAMEEGILALPDQLGEHIEVRSQLHCAGHLGSRQLQTERGPHERIIKLARHGGRDPRLA